MISILRNNPTPTCANYPTPAPTLRREGSLWMEVNYPTPAPPLRGEGSCLFEVLSPYEGRGLFIRDKCSRRDLSGRC